MSDVTRLAAAVAFTTAVSLPRTAFTADRWAASALALGWTNLAKDIRQKRLL